MFRFYLEPDEWDKPEAVLSAEEAHHLAAVLRIGPGETVTVFDGGGQEGGAIVRQVSKRGVTLHLQTRTRQDRPATSLVLLQAIAKAQQMDWIVQKATELGAAEIVPVLTERVVVRLRPDEYPARRERWGKIARGAAKQCGSAWIPAIAPVTVPAELPALLPGYDLFLVGSLAGGATPLSQVLARFRVRRPTRVGVWIGPEGDLTPDEVRQATGAGGVAVNFGPRTLRAETAALFALSILAYEFG